jgi:hypothetical protein
VRLTLFVLSILVLQLQLVSCVPVSTNPEIDKTAITSIQDSSVYLQPGAVYSLADRVAAIEDDAVVGEAELHRLLVDAIHSYLGSQGFNQQVSSEKVDFRVGYVFATEAKLKDGTLAELFGVDPGLQSHAGLEKGTLLIYILDGGTEQLVWRVAMQGFINEDRPVKKRAERVRQIVVSMMSHFRPR